ncbi:hypothetical protein BLOT_011591 [Blomia tropicalis]|nr:hypothetical protein BLOT_011591 [Blomia tropicalis]
MNKCDGQRRVPKPPNWFDSNVIPVQRRKDCTKTMGTWNNERNESNVQAAPIIPILTAIATTAAGIFQIQVDTLHIAKYMRQSANCKKNRASFVRDLLYTAFYRSGQTHNVMVFNLEEEHRQRLYNVQFYGSVTYSDGSRFGVWVFDYGVFENKGARGWHNWGMIGTFKKSKNGETIYFQQRHKKPISNGEFTSVRTTTTTSSPLKNLTTELNVESSVDLNGTTTVLNTSTTITNTITSTMLPVVTYGTTTDASTTTTTISLKDILKGFDENPSPFDNKEVNSNVIGNKDGDDEEPRIKEINIDNHFAMRPSDIAKDIKDKVSNGKKDSNSSIKKVKISSGKRQ